ncbi:hypothetical protein, partial [Escherichia coli]
MQQLLEEGLIPWAGAAGFALLSIIVGFVVYKTLVYLVGRFSKPTSVTRIFFDSAARALGTSLCLLAINSVLHTFPEDLIFLGPIQ